MLQTAQTAQTPPLVIPAKAGIYGADRMDPGFRRNDDSEGYDRLSHAIFFADELSNSRLRKKKAAWTAARRKEKSLLIQKIKPWQSSTGPRTPSGKERSAANSNNGQMRDPVLKIADNTLRAQSRFLARLKRALALKKVAHPRAEQELADCLEEGWMVTAKLAAALAFTHFGPSVTMRNNE